MTSIETAFLCAIYALYLFDCVHWIGPEEQAFTRLSATTWKATKIGPLSFTLARRRPLLVAPFLVRPGFIRCSLTTDPTPRHLRTVSRRLERLVLVLTLCRAQAFLLLVYLPLLVVLHRLVAVWPIFLGVLLLLHIALSVLAIRALRRTSVPSSLTASASIALNPLGATRVLDVLSQAFFDEQQARAHRGLNSKQQ